MKHACSWGATANTQRPGSGVEVRWTQRRRRVELKREASSSSGVGSPTRTFAFPWPKESAGINKSTNKVMIASNIC